MTDRMLHLMERLTKAVEKIANKKPEIQIKDSNPEEPIYQLLQPGLNLSQWRISSLKRIEKACEIIDEWLKPSHPFDEVIEENPCRMVHIPLKSNTIILSIEELQNLRKILMVNEK